jgi:hypothetical protein
MKNILQIYSLSTVSLESHRDALNIIFFRAEVITEKRVRRWAIAMEELVSDPTGKNSVSLNIMIVQMCLKI